MHLEFCFSYDDIPAVIFVATEPSVPFSMIVILKLFVNNEGLSLTEQEWKSREWIISRIILTRKESFNKPNFILAEIRCQPRRKCFITQNILLFGIPQLIYEVSDKPWDCREFYVFQSSLSSLFLFSQLVSKLVSE